MPETDFTRYTKKLKNKQDKFRNSFRYKKLIAEAVKTIINNDSLVFSKDDIRAISDKVYKRQDLLVCGRVRSTLNQELVKADINTALIEFYSSAGLDKKEAINLLNLAKEMAKEKKDVTNLLKIVEKYETAANLTHKNAVNVSQTQIIDYSKLGKDGLPTVKTVKTIETTINNAQDCDIRQDQEQVNDNTQPIVETESK